MVPWHVPRSLSLTHRPQGSSAIANYYSLQGLYDGLQIFALVLASVGATGSLAHVQDTIKLIHLPSTKIFYS